MSDIEVALKDLGITLDQLNTITNTGIVINIPLDNVELKNSPIHGLGLFATENIPPHTIIGQVLIDVYKTQLGRYTNHSLTPNIVFVYVKEPEDEVWDNIIAISTKMILKKEELLVDYRSHILNPIILPPHLSPE